MDWFYANNGQQVGPVSETQLDQLAQAGTVTPATLVWRQGAADWQPYSVARPTLPTPPSASPQLLPPIIDQQRCVECQRVFSTSDLLRYENVHVCAECKPAFFQKIREGLTPGLQIWKSGKFLVLRKDAALPPRCVKCNAPQHGNRIKRKLFWHPPWIYVLIPAGLLVYAIVATIIGKRAIVDVPLCVEHRRLRWRDLLITWVIILSCLGAFAYAIVASSGWFALVGLLLLFAAAIYGSIRTTIVTPKRIDDHFAWLKGVGPEYLAPFPEFTGR
jgi:hypothetical protein